MSDETGAQVSPDWQPTNHGIVCWGTVPANALLCVTGIPRTGTTSAAELVCSLWPAEFHFDSPNNLEHYRLAAHLKDGNLEAAKNMIGDQRFAWKSPALWMVEGALRELAGPRIAWLVTTRDVTSTALREAEYRKQPVDEWLQREWRWSSEMGRWFGALQDPRAIVSSEKLLIDRASIRMQIKRWLAGAPT